MFLKARYISGAVLSACLLSTTLTHGYGPEGHKLAGAIADHILAGEPAVATKVKDLLDGLTLEAAALLPDDIKSWDKKAIDDPTSFHLSSLSGHAEIEDDLKAFWKANPYSVRDPNLPNHHWFHYTDVPVAVAGIKYSDAHHGESQFDIVHMIPFCIDVLSEQTSVMNERKITRRVALILLAHYLGDLHQPLHVGAEYFNADGEADPDCAVADGDLPEWLAHHEPAGWKEGTTGALETWAEAWANEILPIARQAHERLEFTKIEVPHGRSTTIQQVMAEEKYPQPDGVTYQHWAGKVVRDEIHKAGWRLAELLRKCLH